MRRLAGSSSSLDITNEENVQDLLIFADNKIKNREDLEVKTKDFKYFDPDDDEGDGSLCTGITRLESENNAVKLS